MATLKDVERSQKGGDTPQSIQDHIGQLASAGVQDVDVDYVIFRMKNVKRRGCVHIDGQDDVINPKTGKVERARLLTGIDTIWAREQKDVSPDYVRMNRRSLKFERGGILRIKKSDHTGLLFAQLCNSNIGAPERVRGATHEFFEYNPQKQAEESLKKELLGIDMAFAIKDFSDDEVKKYASYLKMTFFDELQQPKPPEALRRELILYATRNPELFQKMTKDKLDEVNLQFQIKNAIISSKIDIGSTPGAANWGTGGTIARIPSGAKPLEYLTELAMTNTPEGRAFKDQLNKISS